MAKVNVSLRENVLRQIDEIRMENRISRSGFLEIASLLYLQKIEEGRKEQEKQEVMKRAYQIKDEEYIKGYKHIPEEIDMAKVSSAITAILMKKEEW